MKKILFLALGLAFALPSLSFAHGPTRLKVVGTIEIDAPPAKVWTVVKDFNGMPNWHPAIKDSTCEGCNDVGANRVLTLQSGGMIKENLEKYDEEGMRFFYRITEVDPKVLPVNNYSSWLIVEDNGNGGSKVTWKGAFYRGFPGNNPPEDMNDATAKEAIHGVYKSGLENLKASVETK